MCSKYLYKYLYKYVGNKTQKTKKICKTTTNISSNSTKIALLVETYYTNILYLANILIKTIE